MELTKDEAKLVRDLIILYNTGWIDVCEMHKESTFDSLDEKAKKKLKTIRKRRSRHPN